jgi:hypothetical protein
MSDMIVRIKSANYEGKACLVRVAKTGNAKGYRTFPLRGGSLSGSSVPTMEAQYASRNHDAVRMKPEGRHRPRAKMCDALAHKNERARAAEAEIARIRANKRNAVRPTVEQAKALYR